VLHDKFVLRCEFRYHLYNKAETKESFYIISKFDTKPARIANCRNLNEMKYQFSIMIVSNCAFHLKMIAPLRIHNRKHYMSNIIWNG